MAHCRIHSLLWATAQLFQLVIAIPSFEVVTVTLSTVTPGGTQAPVPWPSIERSTSNHTLHGCYTLPSKSTQVLGNPRVIDNSLLPDLTVQNCLKLCSYLMPPEQLTYAAIQKKSDCICGESISLGATRTDITNCLSPCSGDIRVSCGGSEYALVYSSTINGSMPAGSNTINAQGEIKSRNKAAIAVVSVVMALVFVTMAVLLRLSMKRKFRWHHSKPNRRQFSDVLFDATHTNVNGDKPNKAGANFISGGVFGGQNHLTSVHYHDRWAAPNSGFESVPMTPSTAGFQNGSSFSGYSTAHGSSNPNFGRYRTTPISQINKHTSDSITRSMAEKAAIADQYLKQYDRITPLTPRLTDTSKARTFVNEEALKKLTSRQSLSAFQMESNEQLRSPVGKTFYPSSSQDLLQHQAGTLSALDVMVLTAPSASNCSPIPPSVGQDPTAGNTYLDSALQSSRSDFPIPAWARQERHPPSYFSLRAGRPRPDSDVLNEFIALPRPAIDGERPGSGLLSLDKDLPTPRRDDDVFDATLPSANRQSNMRIRASALKGLQSRWSLDSLDFDDEDATSVSFSAPTSPLSRQSSLALQPNTEPDQVARLETPTSISMEDTELSSCSKYPTSSTPMKPADAMVPQFLNAEAMQCDQSTHRHKSGADRSHGANCSDSLADHASAFSPLTVPTQSPKDSAHGKTASYTSQADLHAFLANTSSDSDSNPSGYTMKRKSLLCTAGKRRTGSLDDIRATSELTWNGKTMGASQVPQRMSSMVTTAAELSFLNPPRTTAKEAALLSQTLTPTISQARNSFPANGWMRSSFCLKGVQESPRSQRANSAGSLPLPPMEDRAILHSTPPPLLTSFKTRNTRRLSDPLSDGNLRRRWSQLAKQHVKSDNATKTCEIGTIGGSHTATATLTVTPPHTGRGVIHVNLDTDLSPLVSSQPMRTRQAELAANESGHDDGDINEQETPRLEDLEDDDEMATLITLASATYKKHSLVKR